MEPLILKHYENNSVQIIKKANQLLRDSDQSNKKCHNLFRAIKTRLSKLESELYFS